MAAGNKHLAYKEALNEQEQRSPGTKSDFYFGFLARAVDRLGADGGDRTELGHCVRCGAPAGGDICAFCRLVERVSGAEPVPVELVSKARR